MERAAQAGLTRLLVPAVDVGSARRVIELAEDHRQLFAAVGIHPAEVAAMTATDLASLQPLAAESKVVAIGEIGLDYYWITEPIARLKQREMLRAQLDLASSVGKPVVLHLREAKDADYGDCVRDMIGILQDWVLELRNRGASLSERPGVLHSFSGTLETALKAIELGFYIGITGPVTFPNAEQRRRVVAALPVERILLETDAPFLAPQAQRGRRNEPAFVADIADRIAQVQSRAVREVAESTSANAARLFGWGASV